MNFQDLYSIFVTKDLQATKAFYTEWLGFVLYFESSFFILIGSQGERQFSIGFIDEVHPSSPPDMPALDSRSGVFLTLQVEDAEAEYGRLKEAGVEIYYHLKDEPWGQRRFGLVDPNGLYIDIVQQTEPQEGFWDQYPPR